MPRVRMFFSEMPTGYYVTFSEFDSATKLGRLRKYGDQSRVFDILRAAHAPLEDHQALEYALNSRRPGSVVLNLSAEQYQRLKYGK